MLCLNGVVQYIKKNIQKTMLRLDYRLDAIIIDLGAEALRMDKNVQKEQVRWHEARPKDKPL